MELHRGSNAVLSCNKNFIALLSGPYLPSHRFWKILFNLSLTDSKIHLLSSTLVMRRILMTALAFCLVHFAFAQNDSTAKKTTTTKKYAPGRSNDHFLMQLGYTTWTGKPDSIKTKGFPRTFNIYLMLDFPFKTNPHWSVAIGPGIGSDNIYFDKMTVGIKDATSKLVFKNVSDTVHFKKYKLNTAYLEAPIELRYRTNSADDAKSVKFALGVKVGTLLSAHVKGKNLENAAGNTVLDYIMKENSKRFFNKTRLSGMFRVGYGHFSLFTSYAITPIFKEGFAPTIRPLTIGLTLSGL